MSERDPPRLYTSRISPFCAVLEVFLRYEGIAHNRVEVDPYRKTLVQQLGLSGPFPKLPLVLFVDGTHVSKAQETIDALQARHGTGKCGPFTVAQKNQCMRISQHVLPLVALNRHLSLKSSRETARFISPADEKVWGWWATLMSRYMVPLLYWSSWRKMGNTVMRETGYTKCGPQEALVTELEKWQGEKGGELFGGSAPNIVDLWLYGQIAVFKDESLYKLVERHCPETLKFVRKVEGFL